MNFYYIFFFSEIRGIFNKASVRQTWVERPRNPFGKVCGLVASLVYCFSPYAGNFYIENVSMRDESTTEV